MCFTPGLKLQRQLNYTKCLIPYVVSSTQNRELKKKKSYIQILDMALNNTRSQHQNFNGKHFFD